MSNAPNNKEQSVVFSQTPTQSNPGAAKSTDFQIVARDGGQRGDSPAERAALLAEADSDGKSALGSPLPERNKVPSRHE